MRDTLRYTLNGLVALMVVALASTGLSAPAFAAGENCKARTTWDNVKQLEDTCKKLKDERDRLLAARDAEAAMSNIDGMTPAHICLVLSELAPPKMTDGDAARCFQENSLSDRVRAAVADFQSSLTATGVRADGWLKTDQYVQLVCAGVRAKGPNAMRFASVMFANGQGLPTHVGKAKFLAKTAADVLDRKTRDPKISATTRAIITVTQNKNQDVINVLNARPDPEWQGTTDTVCPIVDDMRSQARQRAVVPMSAIQALAPNSQEQNLGLDAADVPTNAAQEPKESDQPR